MSNLLDDGVSIAQVVRRWLDDKRSSLAIPNERRPFDARKAHVAGAGPMPLYTALLLHRSGYRVEVHGHQWDRQVAVRFGSFTEVAAAANRNPVCFKAEQDQMGSLNAAEVALMHRFVQDNPRFAHHVQAGVTHAVPLGPDADTRALSRESVAHSRQLSAGLHCDLDELSLRDVGTQVAHVEDTLFRFDGFSVDVQRFMEELVAQLRRAGVIFSKALDEDTLALLGRDYPVVNVAYAQDDEALMGRGWQVRMPARGGEGRAPFVTHHTGCIGNVKSVGVDGDLVVKGGTLPAQASDQQWQDGSKEFLQVVAKHFPHSASHAMKTGQWSLSEDPVLPASSSLPVIERLGDKHHQCTLSKGSDFTQSAALSLLMVRQLL